MCIFSIHEMHVVFVSFFSNQKKINNLLFSSKRFLYVFQRNLHKCTIYTSFSLLKIYHFFLFLSKLDLSAYLSYYMLSVAFISKIIIFFIIVYRKALSDPAATDEESSSIKYRLTQKKINHTLIHIS